MGPRGRYGSRPIKYSEPDLLIRRTVGHTPDEDVTCRIEYCYGFEFFGAYETWQGGYTVTGLGHTASNIQLEVALKMWAAKCQAEKDAKQEAPKK